MDTDIKNLIRTGTVSSINAENGTVRVTYDDKDGILSGELHTIARGGRTDKDYWLPDVGEPVVCLFNPASKNLNDGWVIGTSFSHKNPPNARVATKRRIDFGGGSYFEFDRADGSLTIHCTGPIKINGSTINLN